MRIAIPHHTTRESARKIVEERLRSLEHQYGHHAQDIEHEWHGDTLHFGFKAKGMSGTGTLEVTDTDVVIDGKLPLLARPFESRIRHTLEREAESMFRA